MIHEKVFRLGVRIYLFPCFLNIHPKEEKKQDGKQKYEPNWFSNCYTELFLPALL